MSAFHILLADQTFKLSISRVPLARVFQRYSPILATKPGWKMINIFQPGLVGVEKVRTIFCSFSTHTHSPIGCPVTARGYG